MQLQADYSDLTVLERRLDGLDDAGRIAWMRGQKRRAQREIWGLAASAAPIGLDHFVPADRGAGTVVRHAGQNTLPLPWPHKHFEKRFCRAADGTVFGYNEAPSRPFIGPGYFVVGEGDEGLFIDYRRVPDGDVPTGWPRVVPNEKGLQWFVYRGTLDFMRRVSRHVSIGAAYKGNRSLDHYFLLCREP